MLCAIQSSTCQNVVQNISMKHIMRALPVSLRGARRRVA